MKFNSLTKRFSTLKSKVMTIDTINPNLVKAEYAVRGAIPIRASQIKQELKSGQHHYPFDSLTELNIGNPQIFGQKPLTFNRQVLATLLNIEQADSMPFHKDVINRAKWYYNQIGFSIGAYSESNGYQCVRENICKFIQKRDGPQAKTNPNHIYLTTGASEGVHQCTFTLRSSENDGVLIPIPQYPLYTAVLSLIQAKPVPYFLNEEAGWQIDVDNLDKVLQQSKDQGIQAKAMVIINPGNPTGQILNEEQIQKIVRFCYDNNLVIMADEVYQNNIYKQGAKFVSFKKVVSEMPHPYNQTELISFHSTSKGITGECGIRGGYFETTNIDQAVCDQIFKMKSISLCSTTVGQIMTDLMVNPPTKELGCSDETIQKHEEESRLLLESLARRAQIVSQKLNEMDNITCNEVEGAMYAFPRIHFSEKVIQEAQKQGVQPDFLYCKEVLEKTGIVVVPGSGFGQKEGTHHFRTTNLVLPEERLLERYDAFKQFNNQFHQQFK